MDEREEKLVHFVSDFFVLLLIDCSMSSLLGTSQVHINRERKRQTESAANSKALSALDALTSTPPYGNDLAKDKCGEEGEEEKEAFRLNP